MTDRRPFVADQSGTASVELVMILPLMFALLFPAMELGHFFWTQHKLVEAVRDGSRYASRLGYNKVCDGGTLKTDMLPEIKRMTRTGQIGSSTAVPKVAGWTDDQVTVTCQTFVNTGIYSDLGGNGAIVTVAATNVPYPSLLQRLGLISSTVNMNARASGPVIGI